MQFRSIILEPDGRRAVVELEAASEAALATRLLDNGRILIQAEQSRRAEDTRRGRALAPKQLLAFTDALESLLDGGVPVITALEAIAEQEEDLDVADIYRGIARRIGEGDKLAEAFRMYPRSFSTMYVEILAAGEESGNIDGSLKYLSDFLKWSEEIRGVIKQATVYPIVVMSAAYGLVIFMLGVVVPKLAAMLEGMVTEMPPSSQVLFAMSGFVEAHLGKIFLGTLVFVFLLRRFLRSPGGQRTVLSGLSRMPVARGIVVALNRARACRTLGVLIASGLTIVKSLELTARIVTLPWFRAELEQVRVDLTEGAMLSAALSETDVLSPFGRVLLKAGEDTGRFDRAFDRMAGIYDHDARSEVKRAIGYLEPAMTVFIGIVIAGIAVTVINTIYSAIQGVQGS